MSTARTATREMSPEEMVGLARHLMADGKDPRHLLDVAIARRDKWARLAEEWDSYGEVAGRYMDGRASIYTGETYAQARDRWEAYRVLLVEELRGHDGGLS